MDGIGDGVAEVIADGLEDLVGDVALDVSAVGWVCFVVDRLEFLGLHLVVELGNLGFAGALEHFEELNGTEARRDDRDYDNADEQMEDGFGQRAMRLVRRGWGRPAGAGSLSRCARPTTWCFGHRFSVISPG